MEFLLVPTMKYILLPLLFACAFTLGYMSASLVDKEPVTYSINLKSANIMHKINGYSEALKLDLPNPHACSLYKFTRIENDFVLTRIKTDSIPEDMKLLSDDEKSPLNLRLHKLVNESKGGSLYLLVIRKPDMNFKIWYLIERLEA